jgi:hypothetical protein
MKIVIRVLNGLIEEVYTDCDATVEIYDFDNQDCDENGVPASVITERQWKEAISQSGMRPAY